MAESTVAMPETEQTQAVTQPETQADECSPQQAAGYQQGASP